MARIELKHCTVRFKDGFRGTAAVDDTLLAGDSVMKVDTLAGLPDASTKIPVGARFTVVGDSVTTFRVTASNANARQTVTITDATDGTFTLTFGGQTTAGIAWNALAAAVQSALEALSSIAVGDVEVTGVAGAWTVEFKGANLGTALAAMVADGTSLVGAGAAVAVAVEQAGGTTWELTFSPAIRAAAVPADNAVITLLPQQIDIKIGDGNVTYSEKDNYEYDLDRGMIDSVRKGDEVPLDVALDFVYEFISTGTGEAITPMDALKGKGGASGWFSASSDPCEPYAIDIEIDHVPPCGSAERERTIFPEFRSESRDVDLGEASVSVSGRCNAIEPLVVRYAA